VIKYKIRIYYFDFYISLMYLFVQANIFNESLGELK
jgi:hypothetical protein